MVTKPSSVIRETPVVLSNTMARTVAVFVSPGLKIIEVRSSDPGSGIPAPKLVNGSRPTLYVRLYHG